MRENIKVVFMGTPEFAAESLKELVEAGFNVVACFTNPDRPSGRGMKMKASPVKEYALEHNIPVYQPEKVRKKEILELLKSLEPDFLAVVAYGKILPQSILDVAKYGAINVHGSLLPKYRGSAPMQWSIINGEAETGITTMYMDKGMDTGDMILVEKMDILDEYDLGDVHDKMMVMGAKLLVKTLDEIVAGTAPRTPQPEEGVTMAPMIEREMTKIDFNKDAREIFNFVRGLSPFPGTYMETESGKKFKVFATSYVEEERTEENGQIIILEKEKFGIKCNNGYILIKTIQPENSKRMDIKDYMNGNKLTIEERFI